MRLFAALGLSLTLCAVQPAAAQDFTFKRIGVPQKGFAGKRITVQIAIGMPEPPKPRPPADAAAGDGGSAPGAFAWFWQAVSPDLSQAGSGRFLDAIAALDELPAGETLASPRLATLQTVVDSYGRTILESTIGTRVSPALVLAVIAVESGGQADAVSRTGASGLMQLMPDTAARFGVADATDPVQNIRGGVAYLNWLMEEFGGDAVLALAGYNAGEGAVLRNSGVPPYPETRGYVPKVLSAWKVARGLCLTPPELAGDGCVFSVRTAAAD